MLVSTNQDGSSENINLINDWQCTWTCLELLSF